MRFISLSALMKPSCTQKSEFSLSLRSDVATSTLTLPASAASASRISSTSSGFDSSPPLSFAAALLPFLLAFFLPFLLNRACQ